MTEASNSYHGNPNLKPLGYQHDFSQEEIEEYVKCKNDPVYFIEKYVEENEVCELSRESESLLTEYHWPGNIRELENTIQRAIILRHSAEIYPEDLNLPIASISMKSNPVETDCIQSQVVNSKKLVEFRYILDELKKSKGNRTITAKSLGISTRALRYKLADMKSKGIDINFKNQVLS